MTYFTKKILLTFLLTFGFIIFTLGQTINEDGKALKMDPDTKMKVKMLTDSLLGEWELIKTVCISGKDTSVEEIKGMPMGTTSPKRPTTLKFNTLQTFEISQVCMKCPLISWSGHYTIEIKTVNGLGFFYLTFIEKRDKTDKKKQQSYTADFNGSLTKFDDGILQLTDKNNCDWIYKRKN